jgi:hypothetical protein
MTRRGGAIGLAAVLGLVACAPAPREPSIVPAEIVSVPPPARALDAGATAPVAAGRSARRRAPFSPGDEVEVEWRGTWYAAVVLGVSREGFYIHYTGYGDEWDETVDLSRIRKKGGDVPGAR